MISDGCVSSGCLFGGLLLVGVSCLRDALFIIVNSVGAIFLCGLLVVLLVVWVMCLVVFGVWCSCVWISCYGKLGCVWVIVLVWLLACRLPTSWFGLFLYDCVVVAFVIIGFVGLSCLVVWFRSLVLFSG